MILWAALPANVHSGGPKMGRPKPSEVVVEVRFAVRLDKDPELFHEMRKYSEVNWSAVSRQGIKKYLRDRRTND